MEAKLFLYRTSMGDKPRSSGFAASISCRAIVDVRVFWIKHHAWLLKCPSPCHHIRNLPLVLELTCCPVPFPETTSWCFTPFLGFNTLTRALSALPNWTATECNWISTPRSWNWCWNCSTIQRRSSQELVTPDFVMCKNLQRSLLMLDTQKKKSQGSLMPSLMLAGCPIHSSPFAWKHAIKVPCYRSSIVVKCQRHLKARKYDRM